MQLALIGIIIVFTAILGGWLLARRHPKDYSTQVKAVLFGLYFWGLIFLELMIAALIYYVLQK